MTTSCSPWLGKIVAGEEDADSVESVFAQAQQVAAEVEALLVDAEWACARARSRSEAVTGSIRATVHDDASESQRTLFSWAEFMAERAGGAGGAEASPPGRSSDALALRVGA